MVKAIAESQLPRADEASPHTGSWPKADFGDFGENVRFGPQADINFGHGSG